MTHQRPAPMDAKATEELNLKVMTRIDPATEEILASAGHVAVYDFVQDGQTWTRKDVEGSLFLQKRRSAPIYQFTILNKKSQCNFSEELAEPFTFEEQNEKYLLYRNVHGQVACLWFHSADDCAKVAKLMRRMIDGDLAQAAGAQANGSQHAKSAPAAATTNGGADDSFWDQASSSNQAKQLQSTDAALNGGAGPSSGPLHKLFSNIKLAPGVTPQHSAPSQPQQQPAPQQQQQQPQPAPQQSPMHAIPMPQRNTRQPREPSANGAAIAARTDSGGLGVSPTSPAPATFGRMSAGSAATPGKSGPPARPPLLTPSFFKQSASQRESAGAASPLPFSLGGANQAGGSSQRASGGGAAPGAAASGASAPAEAQQRQAVRRALLALAGQDAFLDMVGAALQQAGFKL